MSPSCRDDPSCDVVRTACDSNCRVSYVVVSLFQGFTILNITTRIRRILNSRFALEHRYFLLTKWLPLFPNFNNNKSPKCMEGKERQSIYGQDETITVEGVDQPKLKDCFEMWHNIANSAKARYLIQYVDRFGPYDWNPLTACQCLQQCKYDSIEAFDMASSCAYEDIEIRTASLFPDLVMIPGTDSEIVRETKIPS